MYLSTIRIGNFRRLSEIRIELEDDLSGANNWFIAEFRETLP